MKILIPFTVYPSLEHNVGAINKVFSSIISELCKKNVKIILLPINLNSEKVKLTKSEHSFKKFLKMKKNISFLKDLKIENKEKKRNFFKRIFFPRLNDFFPIYNLKDSSYKILKKIDPDIILVVWDEKMTDLFNFKDFKLYSYYGDPQIKNLKAIISSTKRSFLKKLKDFYILWQLEKEHIKEFKNNFIMSNNSKIDSEYYSKKGVNSSYLQNIWKPKYSLKTVEKLRKINSEQIKVIANVGLLSGTANNFGLNFLVKKVLPKMQNKGILGEFDFFIFGAGKTNNKILRKLLEFRVNVSGFVKNIDAEMLKAKIFLCCNNFGKYNVGHTRFLHAWSMGMCVITSKNIRLTMPEFEDGKNCLLASNSDHLVDLISYASKNKNLMKKIGKNGYKTLEKKFSPKLVVNKIYDQIKYCYERKT